MTVDSVSKIEQNNIPFITLDNIPLVTTYNFQEIYANNIELGKL